MIPTLLPAYGRDYKNKAAILADLNTDKDFLMSGLHLALINRPQLVKMGIRSIVIRYGSQRKVTSFKLVSGLFK